MPKAVDRKSQIDALAASLTKSFGKDTAVRGGLQKALRAVPTGSLALDYELGTGGWPLGSLIGVYGQRDIGKSSMIGLNGVKNAQAMDLNCAWVALEPLDEQWATKNGVNVEELLVVYPKTGEEAFAMTLKLIGSEIIDFIVFDSIGAILSEKEISEEGKPRVGGQAGLITWFVKAAAPLARHLGVGVILLNQERDVIGPGPAGMKQQPGGNALEHMEEVIVRLRKGKEKYTVKRSGTEVTVGRQMVAVIERNKKNEGAGQRATFDYFFAETDDYPFGIDAFSDIINTGIRTRVITKRGSYYDCPNGKSVQGQKALIDYLADNPDEVEAIRERVLTVMLARNTKTAIDAPEEGEQDV